jgi:hypothetical protein
MSAPAPMPTRSRRRSSGEAVSRHPLRVRSMDGSAPGRMRYNFALVGHSESTMADLGSPNAAFHENARRYTAAVIPRLGDCCRMLTETALIVIIPGGTCRLRRHRPFVCRLSAARAAR